jgi:hypothetical protein
MELSFSVWVVATYQQGTGFKNSRSAADIECTGLRPGMEMFLSKRCNTAANPVTSRQARLRYLLYLSSSGDFFPLS